MVYMGLTSIGVWIAGLSGLFYYMVTKKGGIRLLAGSAVALAVAVGYICIEAVSMRGVAGFSLVPLYMSLIAGLALILSGMGGIFFLALAGLRKNRSGDGARKALRTGIHLFAFTAVSFLLIVTVIVCTDAFS